MSVPAVFVRWVRPHEGSEAAGTTITYPSGVRRFLFALILLTACTTGSSDPATSAADQPGLERLVNANAQATLTNDAKTTYRFLSADCQAQWTVAEWGTHIGTLWGQLRLLVGLDPADLHVSGVEVKEFSPEAATVLVKLVGPDGKPVETNNTGSPYVYEKHGWRNANCPKT